MPLILNVVLQKMNKLQRDLKLLGYGQVAAALCFAGLGLLALVTHLLGLEEKEFYERFPAGWWVVVVLGFTFIGSLVFMAKKAMDVHPNIQLRSKPDDAIKQVLKDPEYEPWHNEAQRLLNMRAENTTRS